MNWLTRLHLGGDDPQERRGNLGEDFIRGCDLDRLTRPVRIGVELRLAIDRWVDDHPLHRRSRARLPSELRRVGNALVDVFWARALGDRLVFYASTTGAFDFTLWVSDGTNAGTRELVDSQPRPMFSAPQSVAGFPVVVPDLAGGAPRLWFMTWQLVGPAFSTRFWSTDGTTADTVVEAELPVVLAPARPTVLGPGRLAFTATGNGSIRILLAEQGAGLTLLAAGLPAPHQPGWTFDGRAFFGSADGSALQATDGTVTGTVSIPLAGGLQPRESHVLTSDPGRLLFA